MPCCCSKSYRICDVLTCGVQDIVIPASVPADGTYTLELEFLGDVIQKVADLSTGDNFTFDTEGLNERFTYQGQVKGPDGVPVSLEIEGVAYDCIQFTTKRAI